MTREWRVLICGVSAMVMAAAVTVSPVGAAGPSQVGPDTHGPDLTAAEEAFHQSKIAFAASLADYAAPDAWVALAGDGDLQDGPEPPVPTSKTLQTRARQQANGWYCGPASGQVVVNWSRGIINSNVDGTTHSNNHLTQAELASLMGTTQSDGTFGANLAAGLNDPTAVLKPVPQWVYLYEDGGTGSEFHSKIVTDIGGYDMPSVVPVRPHEPGKAYWLTSWPQPVSAQHWIVIRGYNGFWDGTRGPILYYNDSAAGYGGSTGAYTDPAYDVNKTNNYNGGHIVW